MLAGGQAGDEGGALLWGGAVPEERAAEDDAGEEGLDHEGAAERLHDDAGFDGAAAEAALVLGEGEAEEAELGHGRPERAAPAVGLGPTGLPGVEAVAVLDQAADAVLEQALVVVEIKVHGVSGVAAHATLRCGGGGSNTGEPGAAAGLTGPA